MCPYFCKNLSVLLYRKFRNVHYILNTIFLPFVHISEVSGLAGMLLMKFLLEIGLKWTFMRLCTLMICTRMVTARAVSIWKKAYRPITIWGHFISVDNDTDTDIEKIKEYSITCIEEAFIMIAWSPLLSHKSCGNVEKRLVNFSNWRSKPKLQKTLRNKGSLWYSLFSFFL